MVFIGEVKTYASEAAQKLAAVNFDVEGQLRKCYDQTGSVKKAVIIFGKQLKTQAMSENLARQILRNEGVLGK